MTNNLSLKDINIYSNNEIDHIYNECITDIMVQEYNTFTNIMNKRASRSLNESVINESLSEKIRFIGQKIKEFFGAIFKAIKNFFGWIGEKIEGLFNSTKVSADGNKIIPPTPQESGPPMNDLAKMQQQSFNNINQTFSNIKAANNIMNDIETKKTGNEETFNKMNSDLNNLLGDSSKKSPETVKMSYTPTTQKAIGQQKVFYLEKKKNLFEIMKEKFDRACKWIDENYKGKEYKFGVIEYWSQSDYRSRVDFREICGRLEKAIGDDINDLERYLNKIEKKNISPDASIADDFKDINNKFENRLNSSEKMINAIYYAFGIDDDDNYDSGTDFNKRIRDRFQLDNMTDLTTANLNKHSLIQTDIYSHIFNKNKNIKLIKQNYNEFVKFTKECENTANNINNKYSQYGSISTEALSNMLKFSSMSIKYLDTVQAIIIQNFIDRRRNAMQIYNNVIAFYIREKRKAEGEESE